MRPMFSYLHAIVSPTGVYAATDDFGAQEGSTLSRRREMNPSTTVMSDSIRMKTGLRRANRVSHIGGPLPYRASCAASARAAAVAPLNGSIPRYGSSPPAYVAVTPPSGTTPRG